MNLLQRATEHFGLQQAKGYTGYVDSDFWVRALTLREAIGNVRGGGIGTLEQSYSCDAVVYGAISSCAVNLAQVPFDFYTGDEDNPTLVKNSPWVPVFDKPNPMMTKFQLWEATEIYLKLRGECMWVLDFHGDRPDQNIPTEIYPMDPLRFRPIIDAESKLISAWEYREDDGSKVFFEHQMEVLQFKKYNPYDRYRGLSPLQAAAISIRMGQAARLYNDTTLQNSGEPSGVLSTEQPLVAEQVTGLREQFEARHQGPMKAKRLAILHSGLEYKSVGLTPKDLEYMASINLTVEDILAVLKVPKTEVFRYDDVRKETAQVQDKALWTKNLLPEMAYLEDALWSSCFSVRADRKTWGLFNRDTIPALQDDMQTRGQTAKVYFDMGYPVNMLNKRFKLGMDELPWGDVGYLPFNLMPADSIGDEPPAAALPPPKGIRVIDTKAALIPLPTVEVLPAPTPEKAPSAARRNAARRFQMRLQPLEARYAKRLKRFFFELRQQVLERFLHESRSVKSPTLIDALALILRPAKARLETVSRPFLSDAIDAAGENLAEFGIRFNASDPSVRVLLQQRTGKLKNIVGTVEVHLRKQLVDGYAQHETVTQLADRIRDVFNFSSARSNTIARTELSNAANQATVIGERQAGIEEHQWASAHDEAVRDSHAAADGEIVKLDEPFSNGLLYPGDPAGPPEEVIACRCTIIAIFRD